MNKVSPRKDVEDLVDSIMADDPTSSDFEYAYEAVEEFRIQARNAALEEAAKVACETAKTIDQHRPSQWGQGFIAACEEVACAIRLTPTQDTPDMRDS